MKAAHQLRITIDRVTSQATAISRLCIVLLVLVGCSSQPGSIKILPGTPMSRTIVDGYPDMLDVYESDTSLHLIAIFGVNRATSTVSAKWDVYDAGGKMLYASGTQPITIHSNSFIHHEVELTDALKDQLRPDGNTVILFLDDKPLFEKHFTYTSRNIVNDNINGAIMLPFIHKNVSPFGEPRDSTKVTLANTYSDALFAQIKRVIPETVPSFVAAERYGPTKFKEVLEDVSQAKQLSDDNSGSILIGGVVYLGVTSIDTFALEVYVFDPQVGQWQRFREGDFVQGYMHTYVEHNLNGILYKKGLLDYLIALHQS